MSATKCTIPAEGNASTEDIELLSKTLHCFLRVADLDGVTLTNVFRTVASPAILSHQWAISTPEKRTKGVDDQERAAWPGIKSKDGLCSSVSPFCTKMEAWLRFHGFRYTTRVSVFDFNKVPFGRVSELV